MYIYICIYIYGISDLWRSEISGFSKSMAIPVDFTLSFCDATRPGACSVAAAQTWIAADRSQRLRSALGMDQDQSSGWPGMAIGCHWYIPLAAERYIPWYFYFVYQINLYPLFWLVGGLEHDFFLMTFHINWECHHPNWRTHIFQRGWNHQPDETWC